MAGDFDDAEYETGAAQRWHRLAALLFVAGSFLWLWEQSGLGVALVRTAKLSIVPWAMVWFAEQLAFAQASGRLWDGCSPTGIRVLGWLGLVAGTAYHVFLLGR